MTPRRAAGLAAALALVVLAVFGFRALRRARAASASESTRANLAQCLLGPVLASGESASARVHRIVLGNPPADWPARCSPYLAELEGNLDGAGRDADARELHAKWSAGFELERMLSEPWTLDELFATAFNPDKAANDVVKAPPALDVADERMKPLVANATLENFGSDPVPGASLHVLMHPGVFCAFDDTLKSAECSELAKRARQGFQTYNLWPATEDGAESLVSDYVDRTGRVQRFFGARSGTLFDAGSPARALWAFGYTDGNLVTLGPSDSSEREAYELLRWQGKEHGAAYRLDLESNRVVLLGDRLVWVGRPGDTYHLMTAKLTLDPLGLGHAEDLGELGLDPEAIEACRTDDALAVALVRGADARVLFFSKNGASPRRTAKLSSDTRVASRVRACGKQDLAITRVVARTRKKSESDNTGYILQHVRCTQDDCKSHELDLDQILANDSEAERPEGKTEKEVVAGGLGEAIFVAWISKARGIRARLATPEALGSAKDFVIYDDGVSAGKFARPGTVHKLVFVPRRTGGVLFLELVGERVAALSLGLDGKTAPVVTR